MAYNPSNNFPVRGAQVSRVPNVRSAQGSWNTAGIATAMICCPVNTRLHPDGGLFLDIVKAYPHINAKIQQDFGVMEHPLGTVHIVDLKLAPPTVPRYIALLVIPRRNDANCMPLMSHCVSSALQFADSNNIESIAIPGLGSGNFGFMVKESADIILDAIRNKGACSSLREVVLFDLRMEMIQAFEEARNPRR